ncbi:hypothetical protein QAD02_007134 [Eretmocerus hayati]|uniref:Uncharacterized protein n=1 Tax=Eretmocerus hayati TaxID=131215 RepID=A0ACC2N583_9HYME|nr:hypothetical protein QAD02_007134 [Eretmocerus hayati]
MQTDKRPITPPPPDRIAEQTSDKTVQTVGDNLSRLDAEMYAILASKSKIDERDKCIKYLQILRRYLFFKGNERDVEQSGNVDSTVLENTEEPPITEESIVENLPLAHTNSARNLLMYWQNFEPDRFKWNAKGNVIIDGRLIPQSDISKLLANVVSKGNKRGEIPIGQLEMAKFIGSSATPVNLVGNLEILENAKRLTDPLKKAPKRAPPSKEPMTPLNPKLRVVEPTVPSPPLTRNGLVKKWLRYRI